MRKLMLGNEAIARGAYEAGCKVASAYPGTPSTEIIEFLSKYDDIYTEWSTNEKVAMEVASGACIAGVRSLVAMKHVGLNVAADCFFNMAYEGVNAGLVVVSVDDPGMHSSQNEQDNRLYALHAKIPLLEPSDSQECLDFIKEAFKISEMFKVPVLLRSTTRVAHSKSIVESLGKKNHTYIKYIKKNKKRILIPEISREKHEEIEKNYSLLREYSNNTKLNKVEINGTNIGIITSGISYQYVKEIFKDSVSYLKIGMAYPFPNIKVKEFADKVDKIYIVEENEPFIERFTKELGVNCIGKDIIPICGELNQEIIRKAILDEAIQKEKIEDVKVDPINISLCPGCSYLATYYVLRQYKNIIVSGDIGCYTLGGVEPINSIDTVICMGASISAGIGMKKALIMNNDDRKVISIIGDSTFFHSGITGLVNAVYNNTPIMIIIFDNSSTSMTGHQENPGTGKLMDGKETTRIKIENIVLACGIRKENLSIIDSKNNINEIKKSIDNLVNKNEPSVILIKSSCILKQKKNNKFKKSINFIDRNKCVNCGLCMELGCNAITKINGTVKINSKICTGCNLCSQLCKFKAIRNEEI